MEFLIRNSRVRSISKLPPVVKKIIAMLDKLPDGELVQGSHGLATEVDAYPTTIAQFTSHPALSGYRAPAPRNNAFLWANKNTIKAYLKETRS